MKLIFPFLCRKVLYDITTTYGRQEKRHKKVSSIKGKQPMALDVRDYRNDPFVVKKVESAKKLIEKYGLPKELLND